MEKNAGTDRKRTVFFYSHGAYFEGYMEYTVVKMGEKFVCKIQGRNELLCEKEFEIEREEFLTLLKTAKPCMEYAPHYVSDEGILDGYEWEIRMAYGGYRAKSEGYMAYPQGYPQISRALCLLIEGWCKKRYPQETFPEISPELP